MKDTELAVVALNQYIKYCKIISINKTKESLLKGLSFFLVVEHSVKAFVKDYSGLRCGDYISI